MCVCVLRCASVVWLDGLFRPRFAEFYRSSVTTLQVYKLSVWSYQGKRTFVYCNRVGRVLKAQNVMAILWLHYYVKVCYKAYQAYQGYV